MTKNNDTLKEPFFYTVGSAVIQNIKMVDCGPHVTVIHMVMCRTITDHKGCNSQRLAN